jgi:DNA mismatch endonuclease (patch repair protein)
MLLRRELHRLGLRFRKHARPISELRCEADVVFRTERLAVFVDGCFWHACPVHGRTPATNSTYWAQKLERNVERDKRNDRLLAEDGWTVVRVWEHEPMAIVAERLVALVMDRRT